MRSVRLDEELESRSKRQPEPPAAPFLSLSAKPSTPPLRRRCSRRARPPPRDRHRRRCRGERGESRAKTGKSFTEMLCPRAAVRPLSRARSAHAAPRGPPMILTDAARSSPSSTEATRTTLCASTPLASYARPDAQSWPAFTEAIYLLGARAGWKGQKPSPALRAGRPRHRQPRPTDTARLAAPS